jgi:hypothetical protein
MELTVLSKKFSPRAKRKYTAIDCSSIPFNNSHHKNDEPNQKDGSMHRQRERDAVRKGGSEHMIKLTESGWSIIEDAGSLHHSSSNTFLHETLDTMLSIASAGEIL